MGSEAVDYADSKPYRILLMPLRQMRTSHHSAYSWTRDSDAYADVGIVGIAMQLT